MTIDWAEIAKAKMVGRSPVAAAQVIRQVLATGSDYEQWLHRDLLLAGCCLVQAPADLKQVDADLVNENLDRLVAIEIGNWHDTASAVLKQLEEIFHSFGGTALRLDVWQRLAANLGRIDQFRFAVLRSVLQDNLTVVESWLALLQDEDASNQGSASFYISVNFDQVVSAELLPNLIALLTHPTSRIRYSTVCWLTRLGIASEAVTDQLIPLLGGKEFPVVCRALGRLGNGSAKVANALLAEMAIRCQPRDSHEQSEIAVALGALGNSDPSVVAALIELFKEKYASVAVKAAAALVLLGCNTDEFIVQLLPSLKSANPDQRDRIAQILGALQNSSTIVLQELQGLLHDPEADVRYAAAIAIGDLGSATPAIIMDLLNALTDENDNVRSGVAQALWSLDNRSDVIIDRLLALAQDESWQVRDTVINILRQFEGRADEAEIVLLNLLDDPHQYVRSQAISALGALGDLSEKALNRLLEMSQIEDPEFSRWPVAIALGQSGQYSQLIEDCLLTLAKHPESLVRSSAISALGELDGTSPEVVMAVLDAFLEEDVAVRGRVEYSLVRLGQQFEVVRPLLTEWIEQRSAHQAIGGAIDALWLIVTE
jgi:HEAT repeat protein